MDYFVCSLLFVSLGAQAQRFEEWATWTECSSSCGQGFQERKRGCDDGRCLQKETRGCQLKPCPGADGGPEFKQWQEWSRCSKTCGQGIKERKRDCVNGGCVQKESMACRTKACSGDNSVNWSEWSDCSATCGNGFATRIRQCLVGNCKRKQNKICFIKPCPTERSTNVAYKPWQEWSQCSTTCGSGTKTRVRQCKKGDCKETEVGSCMIKLCRGRDIVPGEWETWGACSTTCGYGQKKRKRTCIVGVCEQTQSKNCNLKDCENDPVSKYKPWQKWGPCSVTCGVGQHKRRRDCVVGLCQQVMTKTCFSPTCPGKSPRDSYTPWVQWSACSVTCDGGERKRARKCKPPGSCVQQQSQTCFPKPCGPAVGPPTRPKDRYHNWMNWSPCSVTCGVGIETRTRQCKIGNCEEVAEKACRPKRCVVEQYHPWSQWSKCSASCGAGEITRTRSYTNGTGDQRQMQICNVKRCETRDKFRNWLSWSRCSVTCDSGFRLRVRFCKVGACRDSETEKCKEKDCIPIGPRAKYGPWQSWKQCSQTCGNGVALRKRLCNIGQCEDIESKVCRLKICPPEYTPWEEWGECSVSCGKGVSTRKRYCTNGSCEDKQDRICTKDPCGTGWGDWSEWRGCDKTCGVGFDYRTRECKEQRPSAKCPGGIFDYKQCNTHPCISGRWGAWGRWGRCDVTCGIGQAARTRVCAEGQCKGDDSEVRSCNSIRCVTEKWGPWTKWGGCDVTCGTGQATRTRVCAKGQCKGDTTGARLCKTEDCIKARWSNWSAWGKCSATCGTSEKARSRTCIGGVHGDEECLGRLRARKECKRPPCAKPKWSNWSRWQPCSVTCGRGTSRRQRMCVNGVRGVPGCRGPVAGTKSCISPACKTAMWELWSDWGSCSRSCGGGTRSRTRTCSGGNKGDRRCIGEDEEVKSCNTGLCSDNAVGSWTEWSSWSACSSSCGIGSVLRNRVCRGGNDDCAGPAQEANACVQEDCEARWGDWSSWGSCSATCIIGLELRIRKCVGGKVGNGDCNNVDQETRTCNERSCDEAPTTSSEPPASWLSWSDWSACPVTCDMGTQSRSRICTRTGACDGESEQARYCNTHPCPTEASTADFEGRWSEWETWKDCSVPCGSGVSRRTRTCIGGAAGIGGCEGTSTQERKCKKEDCQWSLWGSFGECSQTCGKGTMTRSRLCADGMMGVEKCQGSRVNVVECQKTECPFDPNMRCPKIAHPLNGQANATSEAPNKIGDEVTFVCNTGYKTKGETKITCLRDGRWSGPVPYCAPESCRRDLKLVAVGQTCKEACHSDSECLGSLEKCLCDGPCGMSCFNPDEECEPLSLPENGYVIGDVRTHGYTVTYGCNVGFALVGTPTRMCLSDGRWTGMAGKCYPYRTPGIGGESVQHVIKTGDANSDSWPWQAAITLNKNGLVDEFLKSMIGGGSLINQNWILTAAHIFGKPGNHNRKKDVIIVLGLTSIPPSNRALPDFAQLYRTDMWMPHEKFNSRTFDNDIGLIKLGKRLRVDGAVFAVDAEAAHGQVTFSEFVRPVGLPCVSACDVDWKINVENGIDVKAFNQAECSNYGKAVKSATNDDVVVTSYITSAPFNQEGDGFGALQQTSLKLLSTEQCNDGVKRIGKDRGNAKFTARMLCTRSTEDGSLCRSIGGEPLVKQATSKAGDRCWVQIGINSWGSSCANTNSENTAHPRYYADTSSLMSWVLATMRNKA